MKERLMLVVLLAMLVMGAGAACAQRQGSGSEKTKTPRPTFTDLPPATQTPVATATRAATATPPMTPTPVATATRPTPTPPPTPTRPPQPTAYPAPPTATRRPQPTNTPAPQVGPHGVIGRLRLREARTDYAVGEKVFFVFEAENKTDKDIPFGILGLKPNNNAPFQTSWSSDVYNHVIKANSVFSYDDNIVFQAPGTYNVKLAICFSKFDACRGAGADWEEFAPGVDVNIR